MKYQRTQISIAPEHHRKLSEEASARGISLAELLRQIVGAHVAERVAPYGTKSWGAIIGIAETDQPTDVTHRWDDYMAQAMDRLYEKKMGRPPKDPPRRPRRPPKRKPSGS